MRDAMRLLWRLCSPDLFTCYIVKNSAPSTKGVNQAAVMSAQTAQDALNWAKQVYADEAPARQAAADLDRRVADAQIAGMDAATAQATRDAERRRTVFDPIEDRIASEAMNYDTPARRAEAAARASADVEAESGRAMSELRSNALRYGGNFDDGAARGGMVDLALGKARARAGAADSAVRSVEAQGHARRMDAAGIGRGVVSSQATQQQIATQSGNSAVGANMAGLNAIQSGHGVMQTGFGQAMQGYGQAGSLYGQAAQIRNQARGQDLNFMSSIFGSVMSDKRKKKGTGKAANDDKALAEVNATPVHDGWKYDPAKGGPDDGGVPHTGPMAQDVHATMGETVAPGGKVIDLVDMNGKLMAGMQALTKRLERVEKKVA